MILSIGVNMEIQVIYDHILRRDPMSASGQTAARVLRASMTASKYLKLKSKDLNNSYL